MEVKNYSYEEFPAYTKTPEGAMRIPTSGCDVSVSYQTGVTYKTVGDLDLKLEILIPFTRQNQNCKRKYPCLVYVQGSAWFKQNLLGDLCQLSRLAGLGYVVAIVQYRDSSMTTFPGMSIDANNAVRFLRKNAERFMIDQDRMILGGCSSGGHTAIFAGIRHNDDSEENVYPGVSSEVSGLISFYGCLSFVDEDSNPTTLNYNLPDSPEGLVMGGANLREHPELVSALSAEENIFPDTKIAPVLLFHGTKDRMVNATCSVKLYEKLRSLHKDVTFYLVEGADHGGPEFFTDGNFAICDAFMKRCFEA